MGAPLGSKNALGNKGNTTYHPSHKQIKADAELLRQMFLEPMSRDEVQTKLKSGKYSLKDLFVSKGYAGNERILLALFNKNFPDGLVIDRKEGDESVPPEAIKSVDDVMALIESTINAARAGTMSVQEAANIGRLATLALKAIEVGELEKKMDLVNSVINERKMKQ